MTKYSGEKGKNELIRMSGQNGMKTRKSKGIEKILQNCLEG